MSDVETLETPEQIQFIEVLDNGKVKVTLPDVHALEQLELFADTLTAHTDQRGVKKLLSNVEKCVDNQRIASRQYDAAVTSTRVVNGVRLSNGKTGSDPSKPLKRAARKYFNALVDGSKGTEALRTQCKLFGVNYDGYDSMEEIIEALVEAQVNMQ